MATRSVPGLFDEVVQLCAARGMNLVGFITADDFDSAQPCGRRCREKLEGVETVMLLGTGGRIGWEALRETHGGQSPGAPRPGFHPIDNWTAQICEQVLALLARHDVAGTSLLADQARSINFRQLGEMVGFGVISPVIGHLIHPEFGPWVSLRAALLLRSRPFEAIAPPPDFDPCGPCHKPCVRACPIGVYDDSARPDLEGCARHRIGGGCADGCGVLHACPVGAAHRYGIEEQHFRQEYSLYHARRWLGIGWWRWVPERIRRWQ